MGRKNDKAGVLEGVRRSRGRGLGGVEGGVENS